MAAKKAQQLERYGYKFDAASNTVADMLELELLCYRTNRKPEKGGLGRAGHFRNIVNLIWGPDNKQKNFIWHPWAEKMNEEVHFEETLADGSIRQRRYLGVSGAASSGKTDFFGVYGLVNWICDPVNTLILCTSTDLKASRLRIWGAIKSYFDSKPKEFWPGRLVDSSGQIVTTNESGDRLNDRSGLVLIAGEKKKERDAIGKIIGAKNHHVIFICDELPELSEALLEAAYSNLVANPRFEMVGLGNFKSRYDAFGQFIAPKAGWDSLTLESDDWETEKGCCIRFDGMRSPNVLSGKDEWPIYGSKQLAAHRKDLGEHTAGFWRMCRSFEAPIGLDDAIYSESDLVAGDAYSAPQWLTRPLKFSTLDPSFTNGGDRCIQWFGSYGRTIDGIDVLAFDHCIKLTEDVRIKDVNRDYQIARQFRDNCLKEGIPPNRCGMDSTAAGGVLHSIISEEWSPEVLRVDFSGMPSDMIVVPNSGKTAKQSYDRKVTELWYVGKEFLKYKQLKGITPELAREMKARKYVTVKTGDGLKMKVETKTEMKARLLFSPDEADAAFVMLHLVRMRHGFLPGGDNRGMGGMRQNFLEVARQVDSVNQVHYADAD